MYPFSQFKNVDNSCRTCLNDSSDKMHDLFSPSTGSRLANILTFSTSIKVDLEDNLPKKLCSSCYNCLISFYDFMKQAQKIDKELRNQLQKTQDTLELNSDVPTEVSKATTNIKIEYDVAFSDSVQVLEQDYNDNNVKEEPCETKTTVHNTSLQFVCKICLKQFYTKADLLSHSQSHKVKHKCNVCNQSFRRLSKLQSHLAQHKKKLYTCDFCPETFRHKSELVKHLSKHSQDKAGSLSASQHDENQSTKCNVCSANFKSVNSLSAHMRVHKEKGRVLACSVCAKVFNKTSHLKRHELSHDANRPYKCTVCPKSFVSETVLKEHLNEHCGIKPHVCPFCAKSFSFVSTLNTHLKVHTREKMYMCAICGKKFDCSTNLNQHTKRHMGLKLFECELCPRRFVSKGELKSHNITHTGERSYSCEQCGATFTKGSSLSKHKLGHQGIKPHQCDTCSMRFTSKDHLKRHYRIHTGEKPYRCDMCDRAFTQSNDLAKHQRAHLGDKLYRCSDCSESFRLKTELRQHISEHFISSRLQALSVAKTSDNTSLPNLSDSGLGMVIEPQAAELSVGIEANAVALAVSEDLGTQGIENGNAGIDTGVN